MKKLCFILLSLLTVLSLHLGRMAQEFHPQMKVEIQESASSVFQHSSLNQQISSPIDASLAVVPIRLQLAQEHYQRILVKKQHTNTHYIFSLFKYLYQETGKTQSFKVFVLKFPLSHCLDYLQFNVLII